jgi:4-hydroxybenzoate polyprenyltransferase
VLVNDVPGSRRVSLRPFIRALRPHQWAKNLLVFVPLVAAHQVQRPELWVAGGLAFLAFSLSASAIYVLNDISDVEADRLHPGKRSRPFAAGEVSISVGRMAAAVLFPASMTVAVVGVSWALGLVVVAYVTAATVYSLVLKQQPVLDVFTLTGLYVLRIVAGGVATGTPLSSWLLAFALFFFLSLAFVKRYAELVTVKGRMPGRGYHPEDALWMHSIGTTAGYMAALVLALYVNASDVVRLYTRPQVLWFLCPALLFWITRLWFRAGRQLVHDDPVIEAFTDPMSYSLLAVMSLVILAAI